MRFEGAAVAVEVIEDAAAGQVVYVEPERCSHIGKAREIILGLKARRRDQPLGRHLVRILPKGHVGQVQEPAGFQVLREFRKLLGEQRKRAERAARELKIGSRLQGKQTGFGVVIEETTFLRILVFFIGGSVRVPG